VNNQTNKPEKEKGKFDGGRKKEKKYKNTHIQKEKKEGKKKQLLLLVGLALVTSIEC